jgi:hypothetical protein
VGYNRSVARCRGVRSSKATHDATCGVAREWFEPLRKRVAHLLVEVDAVRYPA